MTDISISPGETLRRDIVVYNDAGQTEPRDISGANVSFAVYDGPTTRNILINGNVIIPDATHGKIIATLFGTDTDDFTFSVLFYEVKLTETDNTVSIVDSGKLTIGSL